VWTRETRDQRRPFVCLFRPPSRVERRKELCLKREPADINGVTPRRADRRSGSETGLTGWRWVFLSRQTGRLSIVAWPNVPLWVWIATVVARRVPFVDGWVDAALAIIGAVALALWAVSELWQGVSPFRRLLGFAVLVGLLIAAVR
jgi:hypothetical protein